MISPLGSKEDVSLAAAAGGAASQALGRSDFLNLLIAQMKNQDPMQPMEGSEFITQLAQFSELDEVRNMSTGQEQLAKYLASLNNFSALSLLGREVEYSGDQIAHQQGFSSEMSFDLPDAAKEVTVNVYDNQGQLVQTLPQGAMTAGRQSVAWNGADKNGVNLPSGSYRFEVAAKDESGGMLPVYTIERGTVSSVEFQNGSPFLEIGNRWVALDDIKSIRPVS